MAASGGAPAPPALAAFAWGFDEPTHADVRLHVRVCTPSAPPGEDPGHSRQDERAAKRREEQSDPGAEEAPVPSTAQHARSYYAHAIVLTSQSEYFKVG
jgi:hypothetical protein